MHNVVTTRTISAVLVLLVFASAVMVVADDQPEKFEAERLIGRWQGKGSFLMPLTGIEISVGGEAAFTQDSAQGYLRTAMTGSTLLFTYSDSGHLAIDPVTDSVQWEIWDGFGRYVVYNGAVEGNALTGKRLHGSRLYTIHTDFIGRDSIEFRLISTEKDSSKVERAHFSLGRVR